ncbi:MAG: hypothetical protein ACLVJ6_01190 [Merdibacter sp.]
MRETLWRKARLIKREEGCAWKALVLMLIVSTGLYAVQDLSEFYNIVLSNEQQQTAAQLSEVCQCAEGRCQ